MSLAFGTDAVLSGKGQVLTARYANPSINNSTQVYSRLDRTGVCRNVSEFLNANGSLMWVAVRQLQVNTGLPTGYGYKPITIGVQ